MKINQYFKVISFGILIAYKATRRESGYLIRCTIVMMTRVPVFYHKTRLVRELSAIRGLATRRDKSPGDSILLCRLLEFFVKWESTSC
jgi:hypothetical protein